MHHIKNISEASGILAVPAMDALHCLSEASLQKQSSIDAQEESGNAACQKVRRLFTFSLYTIIYLFIPTSHSVSSSTEEYHYSVSSSQGTSHHAQTPPHT